MKPVQWRGRWRLAMATVGMACVLGVAAPKAAGHPDFSGKWVADLKASDFGPVGAPDKAMLTVKQSDPEIAIHSELSMGGQARDWEATCKTDGKECKSTNNEVTLSLEWKGDALLLNRSLSFSGMDIKIHETWTLSSDGKTLTSARSVETPQGNGEQKVIFTKQ
jgi:hypothetical protein